MKKEFSWNFNLKKKYNIIYADPPWKYSTTNVTKKYPCVPIKEIQNFPINQICDDNCALFLWATCPILPECIATLKRWGFRYVTVAFTWIKKNKCNDQPFMGLGNWTRSNTEICLLGLRGKLARKSNKVRQVVLSPLREHSRKPDEIRDYIVELLGDLPRIELFARQTVKGWDCWGNETKKFNSEELRRNQH
jgi:site-specific DNA-methyltransferase (adenine-specific)